MLILLCLLKQKAETMESEVNRLRKELESEKVETVVFFN